MAVQFLGRFFDREGYQISRDQWEGLVSRIGYRRVMRDEFYYPLGNVTICTNWWGLDHSISMDNGPLIFQTLVEYGDGTEKATLYTTEEQAKAGHTDIVNQHNTWWRFLFTKLKRGIKSWDR